MKSDFSRFLHHTLSHSGIREVFTSSLSLSDLIGEFRSNKVANLSNLDYRVKFENDKIGVDYRVKFENDSVYTGRSMVEMLGVLAIIGVLSVGAIASYSKAMMKYKLNKHAEQMNTVINAVARNLHSFDNIEQGGTVITPYLFKMGEIPTEMVKSAGGEFIYDIFGQRWLIFIGSSGSTLFLTSWLEDGSSFLSSKSADSLTVCHNILTVAKENSDSIWAITATSSGSDSSLEGNDTVGHRIYGNKYCSVNEKCLKNLTLDDVYSICSEHIKNGKAAFQFIWKR